MEQSTDDRSAPVPADPDTDRLRAALGRLVGRGVLDDSQAAAVVAEFAGLPQPSRAGGLRRIFGEIAGYVGASFVVGACLLFLGDEWESLGRLGRFAILAGMAVALFAAGMAVWWNAMQADRDGRSASPGDDLHRRLASTLFTGAAAAAAFAAYASLESSTKDYEAYAAEAPFAASVAGLAVVAVGYLLARTALGQLGMAVAAFAVYATLLELLDVPDYSALLGLGTIALGALWAVLAWRGLVAERRLGLAIAVALALIGAQFVVGESGHAWTVLGYVLTALVAGACFTAYAKIRDWVLLAGGVVGATLVVPEVLYDVTDGSLGPSGVMLAAGVTLLIGSLAGLRIRATPSTGT
ncbi:DUF2157 domain-containing protein [Amorphoplanes digitatis]|uniref:DUF2157 domain-containing protein n=1 Tax=Actinoplanes digitatis TaxID=1868 RepID=A0A7W7MS29_9ACTN|nr:DUF2157 domain-containing protein [Actinoplanes digitatis]MBB4764210.1 hypothetical protein [Actinoplanes digitatis]